MKNNDDSKVESQYLINPRDVFVSAAVPIIANGIRIDPHSVARPKILPLQGKPKFVPAHTNVYQAAGPSFVFKVKDPVVITPGKDGVPMPKRILAKGKIVPAIQ